MIWDEVKRAANLAKHGLDFMNAHWVLESFSYVADVLAVLTVIHTDREGVARIISFRPASAEECEVYYGWLESE